MSGLWAGGGSYQAWVDHLETWADGATTTGGSVSALPDLPVERLPADAWQRLYVRIGNAVSRRFQSWADGLVTAVAAAPDEFSAGRALTQARAGLREIRATVSHPGLPEEVRQKLLASVDAQIRRLQGEIDAQTDAAAPDSSASPWAEARRRTVRDNRLTRVLDEDPAAVAQRPPADWSYDPATARRRVIRD
ncbi:hypothetical protein AB0O32_36620 [Streptomyces rubiginosohelvolus]|uniref:hypothetical protein n=1 Tax=Streptomyces rubiginosohelvolus TaxID=67362 RepID=UPI00342A2381